MILAPLIVPLALFAGFAALIFALNAKITSDAFANWADGLTPLARLILVKPVELSISLARHLTHGLGSHWKQFEGIVVTWLSAIFQWAYLAVTQAMEWPYYLVRFQFWLLDVYLPKIVKAIPHLAGQVVHAVTTRVTHVERTIVKLPKLTKAQAKALIAAAVATYIHPYLADLRWLRANFHAFTAVLPHSLPIPRGWTPTAIRRWVRKAIRTDYATAAFAGAVAIALSRLGLGWLRCNALRRVGKRIGCGGFGILEAILATTLEGFVLADLCGFTALLTAQTKLLVPELTVLVDVENKLVGCHGATVPLKIALPPVSLPGLVDAISIAA